MKSILFRKILKVLVYVFCSKRIDFRAILRNTLGTPVDSGLSRRLSNLVTRVGARSNYDLGLPRHTQVHTHPLANSFVIGTAVINTHVTHTTNKPIPWIDYAGTWSGEHQVPPTQGGRGFFFLKSRHSWLPLYQGCCC